MLSSFRSRGKHLRSCLRRLLCSLNIFIVRRTRAISVGFFLLVSALIVPSNRGIIIFRLTSSEKNLSIRRVGSIEILVTV